MPFVKKFIINFIPIKIIINNKNNCIIATLFIFDKLNKCILFIVEHIVHSDVGDDYLKGFVLLQTHYYLFY